MNDWRQRAIRGLRAGDTFSFSRTFTREETLAFGDLTRDYNPVHYDERFAAAKGFDGLICHGLLVGGMICELGGQVGWLASGMTFRFVKPVYFGDTITCTFTLLEVDERGRAKAQATFVNQRGETVQEATLAGILPWRDDRVVLATMVAEGDPTNARGHENASGPA